MENSVISVEGLGKKYIISHEGGERYTALRDVISRRAKKLIQKQETCSPSKEEFWALKDVSFEIKRGEAVGIIGRNGAGKSTLLKILSRITEPTSGRIQMNGRVASLLEVGTGFHPELTGRENIFLNGAILGMSRVEIRKKFDEIVDFSGVEKFLDTPVKRYSSGMYVRLAFAVAAHLEPEILVVDEVLAVGDAEFQKKCLGKMDEVSKTKGRTILFVSHNITALKSLCTTAIWLEKGLVKDFGEMGAIAARYMNGEESNNESNIRAEIDSTKGASFLSWSMKKKKGDFVYCSRENDGVEFRFEVRQHLTNVEFGFTIRDYSGVIAFSCNSRDNGGNYVDFSPGSYSISFEFALPIKIGQYEIETIAVANDQVIDLWSPDLKLTVEDDLKTVLPDKWRGLISKSSTFNYAQEIF